MSWRRSWAAAPLASCTWQCTGRRASGEALLGLPWAHAWPAAAALAEFSDSLQIRLGLLGRRLLPLRQR